MTDWLSSLLLIFIGLSGGVAVGSGMVAFLIVLDIIPRLVQLTRSYRYIRWYEGAVVAGSMFWTATDFFDWEMAFFALSTAFVGLFAGCFVGMLAAALTEVINVLPILAKRIGMEQVMVWLLTAMILGKVLGSLFDWLIYYTY
ncbi:stage V sporulation protein AB [Paenibacillus thalictri]|uniref:Stage V sporulation protein AB n=1 Tax=Paenibacillus thalictri TaxID=2527873 RepID=A0A4Q9DU88_9BACL|nr:stage V sporulation protein AB [Paenibacillus thalictri]TBL79805.1 stage V sporulation protein AB [Paenibacillus thalictri]